MTNAIDVLEARDLTLEAGDRLLCAGLDLHLRPGQCWGMLGRNGAGKTTLLHTLAGLRAPRCGRVRLDGRRIDAWYGRARARRLGLLPQDSVDVFPATVLETALIGRHPHLGPWRMEGEEDLILARAALAEVGLGAAAGRSVATLSGGERRRLALATLLVQAPRVWLLDEPSNHLDISHQVRLLARLRDRALTADGVVLMTLHDVNLALRLCDRLLLLYGDEAGTCEVLDSVDALTAGRLERVYGHPMTEVVARGQRAFLPD